MIMCRLVLLMNVIAIACGMSMAAQAEPLKIIAFGDSLTAGYGLAQADAFPTQLQAELRKRGYKVEVVNAGVSGDTSTSGLARLEWSLPKDADAVILELGANDALRGIDPAVTRKALHQIMTKLQQRQLPVLVAGMLAPPNLGPEYEKAFNGIFPGLAKTYGALIYPFFLDGVATIPNLNQDDGLHPTKDGVSVIVQRILPITEKLLTAIKAK